MINVKEGLREDEKFFAKRVYEFGGKIQGIA